MMANSNTLNVPRLQDQVLVWIVEKIVERVSPEKVVLFGSRSRGDHTDRSDFDIAVFAPNEDKWTELSLEISEKAPTLLKIELVQFEKASERLQIRINKEAWVLYERSATKAK